ncbi:hypothetical protein DAPPUDRAFT_309304 [Daphnia pulex]|uniref:Uncharacterized protein n=1 Tax=Daphnia pulex TaxID=6669 RepID=E9HC16_DAPPU|nr:hypothetical protein DAPPUDRAFT_309304 [Daphnia pulex]|eukprot:EFX70739.1 hypothetical protein DAPPUDRAFT_309304 [Daphnia pulex]
MMCKIAIYCLLLVALIGLVSAAPQSGRSEYGYRHYCEKKTFPGGSTKSRWWTDGELIRLPSSWRESTTAASSIDDSGITTYTQNWYQLNQKSPGGNLC